MEPFSILQIKRKPKARDLDHQTITISSYNQSGQQSTFGTKSSIKSKQTTTTYSQQQTSFPYYEAQDSSITAKTSFGLSFNQSYAQQQGAIQPIEKQKYSCICKSRFKKKHAFVKHFKQKHSCSLLSKQYLQMREHLIKYNVEEDFIKQHTNVIRQIQESQASQFPIPQEMLDRITYQYAYKVRQKYIGLALKNQFISSRQILYQKQPLSAQFMRQCKRLTVKYIVEYKRRFDIFIKTITLSQLFTVFLLNFSYSIHKLVRPFLSSSDIRLFQSSLKGFQKWINLHYQGVFMKHSLFYYHINLPRGVAYCQHQRQWKIDLLTTQYLESLKRQVSSVDQFKFINYVLLCLSQYIFLEKLCID